MRVFTPSNVGLFLGFLFLFASSCSGPESSNANKSASQAPEESFDSTSSALLKATQNCSPDALTIARANPDLISKAGAHGRTPLMHAMACGNGQLVGFLIQSGADPNATDLSGNTALFYPPTSDQPELFSLLLQAGANPLQRNNVGQSALFGPSLLNQSSTLSVLLAAGARDEQLRPMQRTAFVEAVLQEHLAIAQLLLNAGSPKNPSLKKGHSLLSLAAVSGKPAAVDFLLNQGVAPYTENLTENSPIHLAAREGFDEVITLLLKHGTPVNVLDADGYTALQRAAEGGRSSSVALLAESGAGLEERGSEKTESTPLLLAAFAGHTQTAIRLIDLGAAINAHNRSLVTALMHAAYQGDLELVQHLTSQPNCDINVLSAEGHSALIFAVVRNHPAVVETLLANGANPNLVTQIKAFGRVTPLTLAAGRGYLEMTKSLLEAKANPNVADDVVGFGKTTPLILAVRKGYEPIVKLLLSHQAEVAAKDSLGLTAREWASKENRTAISALLAQTLKN